MRSWKDEEEGDSAYVFGFIPPKRSVCAEKESFCMLACVCMYSAFSMSSRMIFSFSFNSTPIFCRVYADSALLRYNNSFVLLSSESSWAFSVYLT